MCCKQSHIPEIHSVYHLLTFIFMSLCHSGLRRNSVSSVTSQNSFCPKTKQQQQKKQPEVCDSQDSSESISHPPSYKMLFLRHFFCTAEVLTYLTSGWKSIRGDVCFFMHSKKKKKMNFTLNKSTQAMYPTKPGICTTRGSQAGKLLKAEI